MAIFAPETAYYLNWKRGGCATIRTGNGNCIQMRVSEAVPRALPTLDRLRHALLDGRGRASRWSSTRASSITSRGRLPAGVRRARAEKAAALAGRDEAGKRAAERGSLADGDGVRFLYDRGGRRGVLGEAARGGWRTASTSPGRATATGSPLTRGHCGGEQNCPGSPIRDSPIAGASLNRNGAVRHRGESAFPGGPDERPRYRPGKAGTDPSGRAGPDGIRRRARSRRTQRWVGSGTCRGGGGQAAAGVPQPGARGDDGRGPCWPRVFPRRASGIARWMRVGPEQ
jgi:hypothetical protein